MTVRVETTDMAGAVMLVTLDRPSRRNAVDHETLVELAAVQAELLADTARLVRVLVLTGAPPAFSAGADLTGVEEGQFAADLASVLRGFGRLPIPVIAAIDGPALGAGAQLVVAADLRIATPDSVVGVPAAKLGLVVDHWTVRRLADEFTPPVARAMLVGAETYTAARLHELGGVHRLGALDDAIALGRAAVDAGSAHDGRPQDRARASHDRTIAGRRCRGGTEGGLGERRRRGRSHGVPREAPRTLHRKVNPSRSVGLRGEAVAA